MSTVRGDTLINNAVPQINFFCWHPNTYSKRKQYKVRDKIFDIRENCVNGISNVSRSFRKLYLRANYHVYKSCCFLVRGISLPAANLFVIAIENILRVGVGNLTT